MGMGDVKLLAMLAAWLGLAANRLVLFLAVIVGALYGVGTILFIAAKTKKTTRINCRRARCRFPFGTMLSLAGLYSIFLGQRTLGWYLQFFPLGSSGQF